MVDMGLDSLLSAAEELPDELKSLWYSACEVDFNLGIERVIAMDITLKSWKICCSVLPS